jgi:hypothetical protein
MYSLLKLPIFLVIFLTACGTIYTNQYRAYLPTQSNGFKGLIASDPLTDVTSKLMEICGSYGGLDFNSIRSVPSPATNFALSYREYSCNGSTIIKEKVIAPPPAQKPLEPTKQNVSIEDAKNKCIDLGFKKDTEAFGTCVIKLSR